MATHQQKTLEHVTPVGGRLRHCFQEWKKVTTDKWILNIIHFSYCIELERLPPNRRPNNKTRSAKELSLLLQEVQELLHKEAIETVPLRERNGEVYSNYFLVPKVDETLRPILDLRFLNKYIRTQRFKMTSLQEVIPQIQDGDFMSTIDLKDSYLHIPINQRHKRLLRFALNKAHYQFTALAFGLKSAPRVFTKCLRRQGMHVYPHLDDWLVKANSYKKCKVHAQQVTHMLAELDYFQNIRENPQKNHNR